MRIKFNINCISNSIFNVCLSPNLETQQTVIFSTTDDHEMIEHLIQTESEHLINSEKTTFIVDNKTWKLWFSIMNYTLTLVQKIKAKQWHWQQQTMNTAIKKNHFTFFLYLYICHIHLSIHIQIRSTQKQFRIHFYIRHNYYHLVRTFCFVNIFCYSNNSFWFQFLFNLFYIYSKISSSTKYLSLRKAHSLKHLLFFLFLHLSLLFSNLFYICQFLLSSLLKHFISMRWILLTFLKHKKSSFKIITLISNL